jgi:hypothetical protein
MILKSATRDIRDRSHSLKDRLRASTFGHGSIADLARDGQFAVVPRVTRTEYSNLAQPKRTHWRNLITISSIMVLIGTEVFGVALAGGWAIAGLFELGDTVGYILMGLFSLFAIYLLTVVWRLCNKVEPIIA